MAGEPPTEVGLAKSPGAIGVASKLFADLSYRGKRRPQLAGLEPYGVIVQLKAAAAFNIGVQLAAIALRRSSSSAVQFFRRLIGIEITLRHHQCGGC